MRAALRERHDADVPCGDCCACCTTAHFVHIGPGELDTLAHVPPALLFAAPGHPAGTVLMGYDERGRCPLLRDCLCSIYEHRPLTCRMYDCRVFAAAGIDAGGSHKSDINVRVRAWRFRYASPHAQALHEAVRAAAAFIAAHPEAFPGGRAPVRPSGIAVLALQAHTVFLQPGNAERSPAEVAAAIVQARRGFPD